ncbi:MAG TPA: hypothetical protein VN874_07420 [Myxococcales bacterium]|jgi:hypothetical protein|nr:hypothetical protein [Myxococcales bacterium]
MSAQVPPVPAPWPFAAVSAALFALSFAASFLFAPAQGHAVRGGLLAAGVGAACALPALWVGLGRGTNGLFAGFSAGFFARMVCVAVGLVASGARGPDALGWALSFFALYAVTQAVEIGYVFSSTRAERGP